MRWQSPCLRCRQRLYIEEVKTVVHRGGAFAGGGHPKDNGQWRNWEMTSTQGTDKLANTLGIQKHLSEGGIMNIERETLE